MVYPGIFLFIPLMVCGTFLNEGLIFLQFRKMLSFYLSNTAFPPLTHMHTLHSSNRCICLRHSVYSPRLLPVLSHVLMYLSPFTAFWGNSSELSSHLFSFLLQLLQTLSSLYHVITMAIPGLSNCILNRFFQNISLFVFHSFPLHNCLPVLFNNIISSFAFVSEAVHFLPE